MARGLNRCRWVLGLVVSLRCHDRSVRACSNASEPKPPNMKMVVGVVNSTAACTQSFVVEYEGKEMTYG